MPLVYNGLLVLVACGFAAMGVGSLLKPVGVLAQFGVPSLSVDGRNEVRAVYGGFGLAMAGILVLTLFASELRAGVCLAIAAALGGMVCGRVISAAADGTIGRTPFVYMLIEAVGTGLLLLVGFA